MTIGSLRLRVLLLAAVSIAVALTLAGTALILIFERHLERRVEQELRVRWDELAAAFAVDESGEPQVSRGLSDPRYQRPLSGAYWQVADASGPRLRSRSLWDEVMPPGPPGPDAVEREGPSGAELYVLDREVTLGTGEGRRPFRLSVALDHAEINAQRDEFRLDVAMALAILGLVLFAGAVAQAGLGLRPLRGLREQLTAIHGGRTTRLSGRFPAEVAPLAADLNLLLEQQDRQVDRARQRAGDLAHGLKTPLTILAGEARRLEERGDRAGAALLREQVELMRGHVERELARARSRGARGSKGVLTPVRPVVKKLAGLLRRIDRGADLDWTIHVPAGTAVQMDAQDLGEVLGNLMDNARKWARGRITVSARQGPGAVIVTVADDGPGIPSGQAERLVMRGERGSAEVEAAAHARTPLTTPCSARQ